MKKRASAIALAAASLSAAAFDGEALATFGGEYSSRCGDPAALRIVVSKAGLTATRGKRAVTSKGAEEEQEFLADAPPDYATALVGTQVEPHVAFAVLFFQDTQGVYAQLAPDARLLSTLGLKRGDTTRYARCRKKAAK